MTIENELKRIADALEALVPVGKLVKESPPSRLPNVPTTTSNDTVSASPSSNKKRVRPSRSKAAVAEREAAKLRENSTAMNGICFPVEDTEDVMPEALIIDKIVPYKEVQAVTRQFCAPASEAPVAIAKAQHKKVRVREILLQEWNVDQLINIPELERPRYIDLIKKEMVKK